MSFAIDSEWDSFCRQSMAIGQSCLLPIDVARIIFQDLKADFPAMALVCKNWQVLVDDEIFRQRIRPAQAFGTEEWEKYIGVDAGKEPRLPRCAYGDLEKEGGMLTFIPKKVKVIKENGEMDEVWLDNLKAIGNLVKEPRTDLETGYENNSSSEIIKQKRYRERPHWVWIKKEVFGKSKTFKEQQEIAKESNARISGLIDTVVSVFMEYIKSGERNFDTYQCNCVRVNNWLNDDWGISLGFNLSGLSIHCYRDDDRKDDVGFALSRNSY